jgi:hypothetical protein
VISPKRSLVENPNIMTISISLEIGHSLIWKQIFASDEDIVKSPFFCADSISVSDFSSFGLTPCLHCTLLIFHKGLYPGSPG